jgi:phospholipase/carboxylesterase
VKPPHLSAFDSVISRRRFLYTAAAGAAASVLGCNASTTETREIGELGDTARLNVQIKRPTREPAETGLVSLDLALLRDGLMYIPTTYTPTRNYPLLIVLHGAGGSSANWFGSYSARAEAADVIVLAPDSRAGTWDVGVFGAFGPDIDFIARAIEHVCDQCAIDPSRLSIGGFSDGASYALSLGLANGDFFSKVVAYSAGFIAPVTRHGTPKFWVSHGKQDSVLNIDSTSRRFVPTLRKWGYSVEYTEFEGDHGVPATISSLAFEWLKNG